MCTQCLSYTEWHHINKVGLHHTTPNKCAQVGFSDKLRLMAVLMDDLKTVKELAIRGCRCAV